MEKRILLSKNLNACQKLQASISVKRMNPWEVMDR